MKIVKKVFIALLILIGLAVIVAVVLIVNIKNSGKPLYKGELSLADLGSEVTVHRDERGMPHIYATNEHDLYLAVGYTMAQERLWQMDLIRRATTGRLSEIFGSDYIETDLFLRSLKMNEKSKMVIENTEKEILDCVNWFVEGVNAYIEDAGKNLPPEFRILGYKPEPWSAEYSANIIGYMGWDLASGNLSGDVFIYKLIEELGIDIATRLIPYYDYEGETVFPDFDSETVNKVMPMIAAMTRTAELGLTSFTGSNNWAVDGDHSETGKPLFSNDMHLGLSSPGIWIQMHHVIPGKLNVTGVVVPGQPFVIAGHNENIAWGMTNLMVDDIDLYLETINENGTKYLLDGSWLDIRTETEIISSDGIDYEREIKYTHRGPIISGFRNIEDAELSMRWSGNDYSNELKSVYMLNRAKNWSEFDNAISTFNAVSQNIIYADTDGNIGLHTAGGVAIRSMHGGLIMPGDTSMYDWKGYVDHADLPFSYNPESGIVSSANNKTVDKSYPHYIGTYFAMPYRINRVRQMLGEKDIYTTDDFKRMITDRKSDFVATLVPALMTALNSVELEGIDKEVGSALEKWDYEMDRDSFLPTFFEYFIVTLKKNLLQDDMGEFYNEFSGNVKDYYLLMLMMGEHNLFVDNIETDMVEDFNSIMVTSFYETINTLTKNYSGDTSDWVWGDIHAFTAEHPMASVKILDRLFGLNVGPFRVGGSNHTVSPYSYTDGFKINHGASERHVYNTANWDESYTIIPTGISGVPSSEFYCSQAETYCEDGFYKDHFSREAVVENSKYRLVFKPIK